MVTFLDTSAIYAYLDRDDANHAAARTTFFELLDRRETLLTHNYVAVESAALVLRRLGPTASRALHDDVLPAVDIVWIDERLHATAVTGMLAADNRRISLVDWTSFVVMHERRVDLAFAFDDDFRHRGWTVIPD